MDLPTIEMTREAGRERLEAYRGLLSHQRTVEDDRIEAGYRAIARGYSVLRLSDAIASGGYFDTGLPRIAIARADAKICYVERGSSYVSGEEQVRDFVFVDDDPWRSNRSLVGTHTVRVTVPSLINSVRSLWHAQTIVPSVPPEHRPKRGRIRRFHILFEVERWTERRNQAAPGDPALLRHIGGDLWAVVATWDLTELERAVLSGRS
jgi:hypothetical protein